MPLRAWIGSRFSVLLILLFEFAKGIGYNDLVVIKGVSVDSLVWGKHGLMSEV